MTWAWLNPSAFDDVLDGWRARAACGRSLLPPEAWFEDLTDGVPDERALAVCAACPVAGECLQEVLELRPSEDVAGVRAGTTASDRRRYRRTGQWPLGVKGVA